MKIPRLDMNLFYLLGAGTFGIQGICNIVLFFLNPQNIFSGTSAWAGIIFSFLLVYVFLSLRQDSIQVSKNEVSEDDIKTLLEDLKKEGSKVVSNGKKH